ncbi:MAG: Eco57I restriction-modification methylase domain-containing protein [Gammaproteobacteria bacterium]|nr:Eco57I restriction-modification methylase domain-containing protein [Gammaproteobacteria bacterium]
MLKQLSIIDPVQDILALQGEFLKSKSLKSRKNLGQFFTGAAVSNYMASLLNRPSDNKVRILDAGAGTGILSISAALRCLELGYCKVHTVLYELDHEALPYLEHSLKSLQHTFAEKNAAFSYELRCEDFVLARPDKDSSVQPFHISIINPPYFKYSVKESIYAKVVSDLFHGDPNIYATFMAIVIACLKSGGQMVSITPRSFTNGLYFKGFRTFLLNKASLDLIHIFKHRNKVFNNENTSVLQENIICSLTKGKDQQDVAIRSSDCDISINRSNEQIYSSSLIIDSSNKEKIIRVPETAYEASILKQAELLPNTFEGAGFTISTGKVVEHRALSFITSNTNARNTVPLYRPHNVLPMTTLWTGKHKKDASFLLNQGHEKHTMLDGNYVLLKRFSTKDEQRRLVAGVHLGDINESKFIGLGNKINYIGLSNSNLTEVEAYGIAAIFNSSYMDSYFRCISGNTQVNATEIRVMHFPSRKQVQEIGLIVKKHNITDTTSIEDLVNSTIGIMNKYKVQ